MTSMFDRDDVGPAINATHLVTTVDGIRKDVTPGWIERRKVQIPTEYGIRYDTVYIYEDGHIEHR